MVAETGCNQRHFEQIFTNRTEAIENQIFIGLHANNG